MEELTALKSLILRVNAQIKCNINYNHTEYDFGFGMRWGKTGTA